MIIEKINYDEQYVYLKSNLEEFLLEAVLSSSKYI